jgi:BirA family transcriptional regulator, biotin operon repressor / biotin---[acetyl-CoA-carboxylase] ligase
MILEPTIHRVESCSSTNDVVLRLAAEGAPEGTVVVAEEQTAGRGTKGRGWYSARNLGLYLSILLRPASPEILLLPLVAGLAGREAVEQAFGLKIQLRWPNDLVWMQKKLGGILCQSAILGERPDYAILGIGINVNHEEHDFPPDLRALATSVRMALKRAGDPEALFHKLLESLANWYDVFCRGGQETIIRSFEAHSTFRKGETVRMALCCLKMTPAVMFSIRPRSSRSSQIDRVGGFF